MDQQFLKSIPKTSEALKALLRADFIIQWKQRRALIMSIIVPVIFLISWKPLIPKLGAHAVLAICVAIGLPALGLMGYPQVVVRDRERGVFQRLRAAPISTWVIMGSRIIVQLVNMAAMVLLTYIVGLYADKITLQPLNIVLLLLAGVIGGMSFLAIGQLVVAYVKSTEAVNAAVRLIYFPLAILGALGEIGLFGKTVENVVLWSPLGTTKTLLVAAMDPSIANGHLSTVVIALVVTLGYGIIFAAIGISQFRWSVN